jgi:hypothetical protein
MLVRAIAIWFVIMPAAVLNGALRDVVLAPRLGDPLSRAISCFTLAGAIVAITWVALPWIRPVSIGGAWTIGVLWLVMTLGFEFGAGHYVFRTPWAALLADYNVFAGRLWVLVLITTLTAPPLAYRVAQISGSNARNSASAHIHPPPR